MSIEYLLNNVKTHDSTPSNNNYTLKWRGFYTNITALLSNY